MSHDKFEKTGIAIARSFYNLTGMMWNEGTDTLAKNITRELRQAAEDAAWHEREANTLKHTTLRAQEQTGKAAGSIMCPRCDGFGVVDAERDKEEGEDDHANLPDSVL